MDLYATGRRWGYVRLKILFEEVEMEKDRVCWGTVKNRALGENARVENQKWTGKVEALFKASQRRTGRKRPNFLVHRLRVFLSELVKQKRIGKKIRPG